MNHLAVPLTFGVCLFSGSLVPAWDTEPRDGVPVKTVLNTREAGQNLLQPDAWHPWEEGYQARGDQFVCDNGTDARVQRGASQTVLLDQSRPEPIIASVWSKAEAVTGSPNTDYSLYLDLTHTDGTPLWGQVAAFGTGTHDWQHRQVMVLPEKPVRQVAFHLLLRQHGGTAWFRDPELRIVRAPDGAAVFDGVVVASPKTSAEGFQIRDAAANSDFVHIDTRALGLALEWKETESRGATFIDAELSDTTGKDRAVTLVYAVPLEPEGLQWLQDPRQATAAEPGQEYVWASSFRVGSSGRLSRYPLGAVRTSAGGVALGIDMAYPAFFRIGYSAATGELFLGYDIGLAPEKPVARVRFCRFPFDPSWEFRAALARYYEIFPESFQCRTSEQGLWMPFARISQVEDWQDFGFKFKEGNNETAWDDAHGMVTFRYTEPMTWWMRMPDQVPRTMEAALAAAERRAGENGELPARALLSSGYHNEEGYFPARLLDTPWCNGAVWSMNSMPGISADVTDFSTKWNPAIRGRFYGPDRDGDLDGEYVDSSEGYVTDELNFRRDHFGSAATPLVFSPEAKRPAIFRGLIAFEYVRAISRDIHGMGKLMMANSTPARLCWLAPLLDVMGTETDWHRSGRWAPMSDAELLYRRAMCGPKPYCFLMNTRFEDFSFELVERYMKRTLAYGMFPGFFSHNASQGHYFTRPELYNRDRPLFKKYVPLCRRLAQAGWRPITLAKSSHRRVYVERFGDRFLTVFNDDAQDRTVTIRLETEPPSSSCELLTGRPVLWHEGAARIELASQDVAVIDFSAEEP